MQRISLTKINNVLSRRVTRTLVDILRKLSLTLAQHTRRFSFRWIILSLRFILSLKLMLALASSDIIVHESFSFNLIGCLNSSLMLLLKIYSLLSLRAYSLISMRKSFVYYSIILKNWLSCCPKILLNQIRINAHLRVL